MSDTDNSRQDNIPDELNFSEESLTNKGLVPPSIEDVSEPPKSAALPDTSSPASPEPPLPEFDEHVSQSEKTPLSPLKTSDAVPPKLADLFTPSDQKADTQPLGSSPVYRISPAEPDLVNNYPLPALDEEHAEVEEGPSGWQTTWAIVREVGETIILTLIIFFLIQLFVRNFRVVGTSMVGNLHDGQYLIIDKVTYSPYLQDYLGLGGPQRGDVIVFKPPRNPDDDYVKRVIGLPGETVQIVNGQVLINNEPLNEPFQPTPGSYSMSNPVVVPEGQVFVLGDNRNNSNDSHNWGPLPVENIVGRAWVSYWPPEQWGTIPRDVPTEEATLWYFIDQVIPTANAHHE